MSFLYDILFGTSSPGKKITLEEFESAIDLPNLNKEEKEYLRGIFNRALKDKMVMETELKRIIKDLEVNYNDTLEYNQVQTIKKKLFAALEENKKE